MSSNNPVDTPFSFKKGMIIFRTVMPPDLFIWLNTQQSCFEVDFNSRARCTGLVLFVAIEEEAPKLITNMPRIA